MKTTKRIHMGLLPYDAKSFEDGGSNAFFLFLINFHPYIFLPIETKDTHVTVAMETYVVIFFKHNY